MWLCFHFAVCWQERLSEASTKHNNTNLMFLTTAAMVDNLAGKVDKYPLNQGLVKYCLHTIGTTKLPVKLSSWVSAIQGY